MTTMAAQNRPKSQKTKLSTRAAQRSSAEIGGITSAICLPISSDTGTMP